MRFRSLLRVVVLVSVAAAWVAFSTPVSARGQAVRQSQAPAGALLPSETQRTPVDPAITVGTLPNGLRYYIRANPRPANRAELRLVINAGSVLEDDDQLGLAHVVEHMAFNGTRHFPGQEIGAFMESIGMRGGPSMNAFTSFDDTTFVLQVPTDRSGIVDRAFQIMEDWARHLVFDPVEIDKERGVIIEEWRLKRGASARLQDKLFPLLLRGSRYADRTPIGTKESIETFTHDRLKQYYRDWYRPDLMAVVAVGDFDKAVVERMVRDRFGAIPSAVVPRLRPKFPVPDHAGTIYGVFTDKETPGASITVYNKLPIREQATVMAYRQRIIDLLYSGMFNARLSELSHRADAPFLAAGVNRGIFVRTKEVATLTAMAEPSRIEPALDAVLTEARRLMLHGFTPTELEREKRDLLRVYEQAVAEQGKEESQPLADEYIRNFLLDESIPGIAWEYEQNKRFLPGITLAEVNALGKQWNQENNRVIVVAAPERDGLAVPAEAALARVVAAVAAKTPPPYVDDAHEAVLMAERLKPVAVTTERTIPDAGVTELVLPNGVKVVLKPTTFKQDELFFRAFSPGGTSLASDRDFPSAMTASQVVAAGGVGTFDLVALRKALTGKVAAVTPYIGETSEGLGGGGSVKDLETILQLVYLYFTAPRADATIFGVMTSQMRSVLANRRSMPEAVFEEAVQLAVGQNHLRQRPLTQAFVDQMNLQTSFAFYRDRFADASDFTFVFVGSFDVAQAKPLIATYLGSLPSLRRQESWKDTGVRPPRGVVEKTVEKGIEPRSRVRLVFTGPFRWSPAERVVMKALQMILEGQLGAALREEQSGTYGVKVTAEYQRVPQPEYEIEVDFNCAPERTEGLVKSLFSEIDRLRMDGPAEAHVRDIRAALLREYETASKENQFLVEEIAQRYEDGEDVRDVARIPALYDGLSAESVRDAARLYLDTRNYVRVTLVPEKTK